MTVSVSEFIEKTVNVMGGVFETVEYALSSVLIPDEYAEYFQGRTEFLLAFDYDVAQENPQSEFVTYGSFIFDALLEISRITPLVTHKYMNAARTEITDAENKIKKSLNLETAPVIIEEEFGAAMFVRFNFSVKYISDEITENIISVWINLCTGKPDKEIEKIFIPTDESFNAGLNTLHFEYLNINEAYKMASAEISARAKQSPLIDTDQNIIKAETSRINRYYDELILENKKRTERKGLTEERIKEISEKEKSLIIEKNRQITEITGKFTTKIESSLENAIVYHIPCKRFICSMGKRVNTEFIVYYDFALKRFYLS